MIKITGLIILFLLVKHDNAADSTPTTSSTPVTSTAQSPTTTPTTSTIASSSNVATTLSPNTSSSSPSSSATVPTRTVTLPTTTTLPTTLPTTTKAPDECYEISCNNVNCTINEDNLIIVPSNVKKCTRTSTGSCYAKQTVDSAIANIVIYAIGCSALKCDDKLNITVSGTVNVTIGCCQGNLCNGVSNKSEGQLVNYNLLLFVLFIAIMQSFLI